MSSSTHLLTRLLPTAQHCFISLPHGTFRDQLQKRQEEHATGCMVVLLEWSEGTTTTPPKTPHTASSSSSSSSSAATTTAPPRSTPLRRVYAGWMGDYLHDEPGMNSSNATSMGSIGLPLQFAHSLSITNGIRVQVSILPDRLPPPCMISFEPATSDDWEILELNTGAIELRLLSQIQIINPGQTFPFWVSNSVKIQLKDATPPPPVDAPPFYKLTLHSEISIVPKPRVSKQRSAAPALPDANSTAPPPPIVRLRVQPHEEARICEEVNQQRQLIQECVRRRKDARIDMYIKEQEFLDAARGSTEFDMANTLTPSPASIISSATPTRLPLITLTSSHYVHVSAATMRFMQAQPDDLVVLSYRRPSKLALPPAPPAPTSHETMTTVLRIAESKCVFETDEDASIKNYLDSAPHYILLPTSLRLAFGITDFKWIHLQKLTPYNINPQPGSPMRQALCVRESLQVLKNIRLKELEIHVRQANGEESPATKSSTTITNPQLAEEDARQVSQAFIQYVRNSMPSSLVDDSSFPEHSLPVPFINGGVISLMVPVTPYAPLHLPPHYSRRFFSVHFNEPDLLQSNTNTKKSQVTPTSYLDFSPPISDSDEAVANAGGIKVSMATSYLLITPPNDVPPKTSGSLKSKKKKANTVLPLPEPVLHAIKQPIEVEADQFEDNLNDGEHSMLPSLTPLNASAVVPFSPQSSPPAASSISSTPVMAFHELGGSPEYHRKVIEPLIRFLKGTLCQRFIRERGQVMTKEEEVDQSTAPTSTGGLMIVGSAGVGKTTLVWSLCRTLRSSSTNVNPIGVLAETFWLDCKKYLTMKLSEFRKLLSGILNSVAIGGPSVIVLEDLDKLVPLSEENDGAAGLRSTQFVECLHDALSGFQANYPEAPVAVLAICQSTNSHHPLCNLIFPHVITIPNPSSADRIEIIQSICKKSHIKLSGKIELSSLGRRTEGYIASDLNQLVSRMIHASLTRSLGQPQTQLLTTWSPQSLNSTTNALLLIPQLSLTVPDSLQIDSTDLDAAFRGFIPSSLKDLAVVDTGSNDSAKPCWEDLGGMFDLKQQILDTFELPVRYAELFAQAPLKLRSGLLLYGPSGCGKTLIASLIAARCGLNFISVKGPELLNKYIGSSEANVRDIFQRARNAAPALLFFDEMDSIVPARGGDSTGVTDRVVNQFLCELDGVEGKIAGGKQLYVLGASSRPDLIDPALLRPGRLDKSLYCGLPNREERLDMLRCMTRKLSVNESEINLDVIADASDDYTPADLQAIITNAQMSLVQEVIARAQEEMRQGSSGSTSKNAPLVLPPLTQAHLLKSFQESKPSTSAKDRARYDQIYQKFRLNREDTMEKPPNEFEFLKHQRQALA